ncbi:hypothetical protein ACQU0X_25630 [Pseudovibrio ascidiaceicola]|uniref:hypothetical protein n=1 Tax=Pseudovibrio ascidiaceicola TaxID=285279 RepID=UPI003D36FAD8
MTRDAEVHWKTELSGVCIREQSLLAAVKGKIDPRDIFEKFGELKDLDPNRMATLMAQYAPSDE